MGDKNWRVYIVECMDNKLYTGITNDLCKRLIHHNSGKGAKFTKGKSPVILIYTEKCDNKSDALKREAQIKNLSREDKLELASSDG